MAREMNARILADEGGTHAKGDHLKRLSAWIKARQAVTHGGQEGDDEADAAEKKQGPAPAAGGAAASSVARSDGLEEAGLEEEEAAHQFRDSTPSKGRQQDMGALKKLAVTAAKKNVAKKRKAVERVRTAHEHHQKEEAQHTELKAMRTHPMTYGPDWSP